MVLGQVPARGWAREPSMPYRLACPWLLTLSAIGAAPKAATWSEAHTIMQTEPEHDGAGADGDERYYPSYSKEELAATAKEFMEFLDANPE